MTSTTAFRGVRISKFRHVYGQTVRREQCYEGLRIASSANDSQCCAVNPKFVACIVEVAGGGAFQVIPISWTGKIDYHTGRINGHQGMVTELKWNPFNDNIIASASEDSTVKLWHIPDDVHIRPSTDWLMKLCGHSRRISFIDWHPTAENVLASVGLDHRIILWNVSSGECLVSIDCHQDVIQCMIFNRHGSLLATTCRDRLVRVLDARTGSVLHEGACQDGSKSSKVVFVGDGSKLVTTGSTKSSRRQMAVWNSDDLQCPLFTLEVDTSSGMLMPFYDYELSILFIAGKGDGNIRYYEVIHSHPFIHYLSEFRSRLPQRGLGCMPKRGLNVAQCEIFRFYKVHAMQALIEPLSFIVPRKSADFQPDLYPPTAAPTPAMSTEEWLCGLDKPPVEISLRAGSMPATCKPVQLVHRNGSDGGIKPLLITADRNNDRKFRFLSEVTKADYREVTEREDYEDIRRFQDLQNKVFERIATRQSSESGDSSLGSPPHSNNISPLDYPISSPPLSPVPITVPFGQFKSVPSPHSPHKIRRTQSPANSLFGSTRPGCPSGVRSPPRLEHTATVRPFRVQSIPRAPRSFASIRSVSLGHRIPMEAPSSPPVASTNDVHRLYTAQCRRVRELLTLMDAKDRRIVQLEADLSTLTGRYERMVTDWKRQNEDIESLRYEIDWKDERIEHLQRQVDKTDH